MDDNTWNEIREHIEREAAEFRAIKQQILDVVPHTKDPSALGRLQQMTEICGAHLAYLEFKQGEQARAEEEEARIKETHRANWQTGPKREVDRRLSHLDEGGSDE